MLAQLLRALILPDEASPSSSTATSTTTAPSSSSSSLPPTTSTSPAPTASKQHAPLSLPPTTPLQLPSSHQPAMTPLQRQIKQLSLFFAGAGFMAASVLVTRRAVIRRQRESIPRFFHASNDMAAAALDSGDKSMLAVQAFGLATLNVTAFGVLMTGGMAWACDLCSLGELRERTQAALHRETGQGLLNPEDEKQVEEMMESLMQKMGMEVPKREDLQKELSAASKNVSDKK